MPPKKIPPGVSPGGGKSVTASLSSEATKDLQVMISTAISDALQPLMSQVKSLDLKVENFQQQISNLQQKTQRVEMATVETKQKVARIETKTFSASKKQDVLEKEIISLQLDKAKTVLRFHNVPESSGDLKEEMSILLAPLVKMTKEDFKRQIEVVYRTTSIFIKKNNLPREVHLRLTNKKLRDDILKKTNETQLTIGDIKIKTLKDIPFLARQRRKKYRKLANLLLQNKIPYMWIIIEGLKFTYKSQTFKLTSEEKLKDFMKRYGSELGAQDSFSTGAVTDEEGEELGEEEEEKEEEDLSHLGAAMSVKTKKREMPKHFLRDRDK